MKRAAETKHDPIVEIPFAVWLRPIVVELKRTVVVAFDVEHVRVAVPVRNMRCATHVAITAVRVFYAAVSNSAAHSVDDSPESPWGLTYWV